MQYNKAIVAFVGVALMLLAERTGIDLTAQQQTVVDLVVALLTVAGVYQIRNQPKEGA
jgi:hypothetical protein